MDLDPARCADQGGAGASPEMLEKAREEAWAAGSGARPAGPGTGRQGGGWAAPAATKATAGAAEAGSCSTGGRARGGGRLRRRRTAGAVLRGSGRGAPRERAVAGVCGPRGPRTGRAGRRRRAVAGAMWRAATGWAHGSGRVRLRLDVSGGGEGARLGFLPGFGGGDAYL